MNFPYLSTIRHFVTRISDPDERLKTYYPLSLKPWDLALLLEKMQGIYDPPQNPMPTDRALIGSQVHLVDVLDYSEMEVTITLPQESNPALGAISVLSPLGAALLGLKAGDTFSVFIGNRMARLRVTAIDD